MIDDTQIKDVLRSQYLAALEMLQQVIERCPDSLWHERGAQVAFWHIAYHALFYVHLYIQPSEADFMPWQAHRAEYQFLGPVPWPPHPLPEIGKPYTRAELLAYLDLVKAEVLKHLPELELEGPTGFDWLSFGKLELSLYSLRHLQQHIGELSGQLGGRAGVEIDWVGMARR